MEQEIVERITHLVFQLALILLFAKLVGELFERFLKLPSVLGELAAGMLIGPFALGGLKLGSWGPLFALPEAGSGGVPAVIPLSPELYAISQIAAIVLLFVAGLETDLKLFLRYSIPGFLVAVGGVALPFAFGVLATVFMGIAPHFLSSEALFVGAIMTATSVGITARILSEKRKLDTPEGVTILAAAVIDDVLGIIVLAVVVGVGVAGTVSLGHLGAVGAKAILFWVGLTGIAILVSRPLSRLLMRFRVAGAGLGLALALAFLAAGLAQSFGLAMIIGAYSIGLALSHTEIRRRLEEQLQGTYHALVPVFFVAMGMLVNFSAMREALAFGIVITSLAIVGKLVGAGLLALPVGFNPLGAWRIGIGMLPRGEVALIMAGVGLSSGIIGQQVYGVAIMMIVVTTLVAPIIMVRSFERGGSGRTKKARDSLEVDAAKKTLAARDA